MALIIKLPEGPIGPCASLWRGGLVIKKVAKVRADSQGKRPVGVEARRRILEGRIGGDVSIFVVQHSSVEPSVRSGYRWVG